jgi:hypothetical protein
MCVCDLCIWYGRSLVEVGGGGGVMRKEVER